MSDIYISDLAHSVDMAEEYFLAHYGVKGMKWGVRKDDRKGSGKTSSKKATDESTNTKKKDKYGIIPPEVLISTIYLSPMAVGGIVRLAQAGKSAINTSKCEKERATCKEDKKTKLLLKNRKMTPEEDADRVNPSVRNFSADTKNNCMLCSTAYDLRRRGYEVQAEKTTDGFAPNKIKDWYPKAKIEHISTTAKMLKERLVKQGNGARGNLMIRWKESYSGHSVAYEVNDGKLSIIDAQIGKIYSNPDKFLSRCSTDFDYARLDNVAFNTRNIKEAVR